MRTRILGKRGRRAERSSHFLLPISPHLRAPKITSLILFLKKFGKLPCFYLFDPFKSGCPRHLFLLSPPSAFIAPKGEKLGGEKEVGVGLGWPRKWNGSTAQGDERESIFLLRGRKTTLYNKSRRDIRQKGIFWMPLRCRLSPSRWTLFMQEVGCLFTPSPQPHTKELQVQYFSQLKETKLCS